VPEQPGPGCAQDARRNGQEGVPLDDVTDTTIVSVLMKGSSCCSPLLPVVTKGSVRAARSARAIRSSVVTGIYVVRSPKFAGHPDAFHWGGLRAYDIF
jgi:hypothetical protein